MKSWEDRIRRRLAFLYEEPEECRRAWNILSERLEKYRPAPEDGRRDLSEKDTMLITYGDTLCRQGEPGLNKLYGMEMHTE